MARPWNLSTQPMPENMEEERWALAAFISRSRFILLDIFPILLKEAADRLSHRPPGLTGPPAVRNSTDLKTISHPRPTVNRKRAGWPPRVESFETPLSV